MATSLVHTLNRPYKGAHKFSATAPDAQGTLVIWARDTEECREHLLNALFDLIFARNRVGAAVTNPPCIFCGGRTQSRGRNSSGTRAWRCMNPDCQRSFVIDRTFRGGINHPTQSKKPAFYHEGRGRRGFGLCPHPPKCNPSENCCVEAEASPASVRESEAYGDDENRRANGGELRSAAAAQKLEDQPEEQASKKHFLQHWSRCAGQEDSMRGRNTTQGFVKRSGDRPDASAGRNAGKNAIEPEPLTRGHPA